MDNSAYNKNIIKTVHISVQNRSFTFKEGETIDMSHIPMSQ